jgi:hypothetical protein
MHMADRNAPRQASTLTLIAPCGLDCRRCRAYIRERNPCPGCRGGDSHKSNACLACVIKNCEERAAGTRRFCLAGGDCPCACLVHLDRRYRTRYGISAIGNLERIRAVGIRKFVAEETVKWTCSHCGALLCMHMPRCAHCGDTRPDR